MITHFYFFSLRVRGNDFNLSWKKIFAILQIPCVRLG